MPAETWTDYARMAGCFAVTAACAAPVLLIGGTVARAVRWWAVLTPAVLAVHVGVNAVFIALGISIEEHPLAKSPPPPGEFVLTACLLVPIVEEVVFRWLILTVVRLLPEWFTWLVLATGVGVAKFYGGLEPAVFGGILAIGWVVARSKGVNRGVYAAAALFALVHSAVWPSPIPLFALGLGLGALAVRTNGILAPVIVHGLFNTVSVLFVLSGGAK